MRDFTSNEYCDFLWINDLLSLEKKQNNHEFKVVLTKSGKEKHLSISNVSIFGTIVEIKQIGERGILYYVDDGTGIIVCKYNELIFSQIFDIIQSEQGTILNETFSNQSANESQLDYSVSEDDTIFNDLSLQEEEACAIKRNRLKALHSIWTDIEYSFSPMMGVLNIGDSIFVQGKLYNYYHTNQIHVNSIRLIDLKEELILTKLKLEDGYEPCGKSREIELPQQIQLIENSRRSGVMTFDHIHHLDTNEMTSCKIIVTDNHNENDGNSKKRNSIVLPNLQGFMTFDTFTDLNDSGPKCKIPRIDKTE